MPVSVSVSGAYRSTKQHICVSTTWRQVQNVWVFVGPLNQWRPMYTYTWEIGSWGNCSVTCGGGTQYRSVQCKRNDGIYVSDDYCTRA